MEGKRGGGGLNNELATREKQRPSGKETNDEEGNGWMDGRIGKQREGGKMGRQREGDA